MSRARSSALLPMLSDAGSRANNYAAFDSFSHPKCSVCKYLPLCLSGCPKQQLEKYRFRENHANINDEFRQYWDESLEALVTTYADLVLNKSSEQISFDQFLGRIHVQ